MLTLRNLDYRLGSTTLLDRAQLTIERGERLCLLGRNGTGKSTLMKLITGQLLPEAGEIIASPTLRITQLPQEVPADLEGTVYEVVASGLGEAGRIVAEYQAALNDGSDDMDRLGRLQTALEAHDGWTLDSRIRSILTRLQLPEGALFTSLSGGLKRRSLLARALVLEPDLLLLDEPTNHLDIDSIAWLEGFLADWHGTLLFISHDRAFLRRLATRIIELDRGRLASWPGSYDDYLRLKDEALQSEATSNALFDKRLAQEEAWIRRGVQARRTRDQGRVERLKQMRADYGARRNLPGQAKIQLQDAERSGRLVAEASDVSLRRGTRTLIRNFSTTLLRGDKIGIIGPNGAGKTTLINLLLGRLKPDSGTVRMGTNLQVAYFDQLRSQLADELPVYQNIGDGRDYVEIGERQVHVMTYLQDFLFTPDRARSPVKTLSGGERARLLLARLFAQPSNLLVLDEPTNDLDIETLELLEERLLDYAGTVWLVSHDRDFIDRVVTRTLVFEGEGRINDYVGGYADWLRQRPATLPTKTAPKTVVRPTAPSPVPSVAPKLNSKDKRELDTLTTRISKLEAEQAELAGQLANPELYQRERERALEAQRRVASISEELNGAYARWEALESQR